MLNNRMSQLKTALVDAHGAAAEGQLRHGAARGRQRPLHSCLFCVIDRQATLSYECVDFTKLAAACTHRMRWSSFIGRQCHLPLPLAPDFLLRQLHRRLATIMHTHFTLELQAAAVLPVKAQRRCPQRKG